MADTGHSYNLRSQKATNDPVPQQDTRTRSSSPKKKKKAAAKTPKGSASTLPNPSINPPDLSVQNQLASQQLLGELQGNNEDDDDSQPEDEGDQPEAEEQPQQDEIAVQPRGQQSSRPPPQPPVTQNRPRQKVFYPARRIHRGDPPGPPARTGIWPRRCCRGGCLSWKTWASFIIWLLIGGILTIIYEEPILQTMCLTNSVYNTSSTLGPSYLGADVCNQIYPPSRRDTKIEHVLTAITALKDLQRMIPRAQSDLKPLYYSVKDLHDDSSHVNEQITRNRLENFHAQTPLDSMWAASQTIYTTSHSMEGKALQTIAHMNATTARLLHDAQLIVAQWHAAERGTWSLLQALLVGVLDRRYSPTIRWRRSMQRLATETKVDADEHWEKARLFRASLREFVHQNGRAVRFFEGHVRAQQDKCREIVEREKTQWTVFWGWVWGRKEKGMRERCEEGSIDRRCCTYLLADLRRFLVNAGEKARVLEAWSVEYEEAWEKYATSMEPVALPPDYGQRPFWEMKEDVERLSDMVDPPRDGDE